MANLAAHGDSNNNNSAVGQEAGALEALVQLTHSPHEGVRYVLGEGNGFLGCILGSEASNLDHSCIEFLKMLLMLFIY